jgi:transglutaminase-like putative cysteine protease
MQLQVDHETRYMFSKPLTNIVQLLRLTPSSCTSQTVLDWRIDIDCDARLREARDGHGNVVHMLYVNKPVTKLVILASGRVITQERNGVVQGIPGELPPAVFMRPTALTQCDDALAAVAKEVAGFGDSTLARLHFLNDALNRQIAFEPGSTEATTTAAAAFAIKRGVCQDFAHIFIAVARLAGVPARYVSGHLFRRDGVHEQQAGHAWAEAFIADLGWVAFDPSNGICADDGYIRVASGLDYGDAAPIAGARRGGGTETMAVDVQVTQVSPRSRGPRRGRPDATTKQVQR